MIQFNLLPDVKLQYIKAKNMRRTVVTVSTIVSMVSIAILVIMFLGVNVFQKKHLNNVGSDIDKYTKQLQDTPDLNKVLTVQNQLNSLPDLHNKKPYTSRLFVYLSQVTPADVSIGKLDVDFEAKTISISGSANKLSTVNIYVDTLKYTKYTTGEADNKTQVNAFSGVVLSSFSVDNEKGISYSILLSFDPTIFDNSKNISLIVPKQITTRSETEKPSELFKKLNIPEDKDR